MNTWDVASKWHRLCTEGKNLECIEELYDKNISSTEMPGMPRFSVTTGKQSVWNKNKEWFDNVKELHSSSFTEPIVAGRHFTSKLEFDITFKDRGRQQMEEIGIWEVKNGKIVSEQFFYMM
ncbi:nuclear transport factor 2 family protein [Winogradskyella alexanderae]|uniref:Nuclear transport factor 2 family protein n=1 Tax=Winogradskyella alexanderae TaxID=2877123 RepID=A0ABS7XPG6_9FLAO|nr:nuclear transport factor 2 family protein [Winogradskyella alexanderae]MCA0131890.1 nuclear transport factor 2 family protein [Winogradskyella alexanderae]